MSQVCVRCMSRLVLINRSTTRSFSNTIINAAGPKKPTLRLPKRATKAVQGYNINKRKGQSSGPPARKDPEALKLLRKRIVLGNNNALEVTGLQPLTTENAANQECIGSMVVIPDDTVEALKAIQAFKNTQGWNLFRKPCTLVTKETANLAKSISKVKANKTFRKEIVTGEKGSGKSVLALQAMAMAIQEGWVAIHIPEAQDIVLAHTAYTPIRQTSGHISYIQPDYVASLLGNIAKANETVLKTMSISRQHNFSKSLPTNTTLHGLAEIGSTDPNRAWPIFTALLSELQQPSTETHARPPLLITIDGYPHLTNPSSYLSPTLSKIHPHDLALVSTLLSFFSPQPPLPNGGLALAIDSRSNRPESNALDFCIAAHLERQSSSKISARRDVSSDDAATFWNNATQPFTVQSKEFKNSQVSLQRAFFSPYNNYDERITDALRSVDVRVVGGLSKVETRAIMEYYARSGILRGKVNDMRVGEEWTISGGGIVGQIEESLIKMRV